jgi:hypothetical protein
MNLSARFWSKVEMVTESGCWIWMGGLDRNGYTYGKHRKAYAALRGEFDRSLDLDHLCRVRCCVNPWHLEPVTHRVNTLRGQTVAARHAAKTHCPNGHAYEGENVYLRRRPGQTGRDCKACWAINRARAQADPVRRAKRAAYWADYQRARRARLKTERAS